MINFLGYPKFVGFDNLGNPLSGGKVWTYAAGTTTPLNTYSTMADALAGTNPNSNPVVLDSRGEALIIPTTSAKLVLTTAAATDISSPIWTVDNFYIPSDIYDSNGKLILKFTPAASAVNYIEIQNSATGLGLNINAKGTDTNIDLRLNAKGTGLVRANSLFAANGFVVANDTGIYDSNGALVLETLPTASAVNYFSMKNNATTSGPILSVKGSDSNINMNFQAKGSGAYVFLSTSSNAAKLFLQENSSNGSNGITLAAAASMSADYTIIMPAAQGSSNTSLVNDGSGNLSWSTAVSYATQSDMETATSTTTVVSPGRTQYHPGVAKFWVTFSGSGVFVEFHSYNLTSLTNVGTGLYTATIATDFSYTLWAAAGMASPDGSATSLTTNAAVDVLAGSITVTVANASNTAKNASYVSIIGFGDQ